MTFFRDTFKPYAGRLVALVLIVVLYGFTRLPEVSQQERADLASHFAFTKLPLPEVAGPPLQHVRAVHPSLTLFASWISSVGASVALNDLDRDGLPNDLCYVEVRTDQVIVAPVPGTATRYAPFVLSPTPLPYDSTTMAPMGCLPGDLNEDGWMDLLVYFWGRTPIAYIRQEEASGMARAAYVAQDLVPGSERWFTNAATRADFDGDGHVDVLIGNYFEDGARILDSRDTSTPQHMHHSMSRAYNGGTSRILRWTEATTGATPSVQYAVTPLAEETIAKGWTLAAAAADLDGDGLPEIYLGHDFGPDRLLHNRSTPGHLHFTSLTGRKTLTTPGSKVLGHDSFKGMGVDFGDINGDGMFDIYVSNIAAEYALEESHFMYVSTGHVEQMREGRAPYKDQSESLGLSRSNWGWESRLADFNNDGVLEAVQATGFIKGTVNRWPELHEVATGNDELLASSRIWHRFLPGDDLSGHAHNPFFVRSSSGRYVDIAPDIGLGNPQVSRGIATADVDGDGDLDFAVANQWEPSYFYRNESTAPGAFLGLHLLLPLDANASPKTTVRAGHPDPKRATRPAVGAFVTVQLPDGRRLVAQVDGGNGHSGARSSDVHLGLGAVPSHQKLIVDIRWRDTQGQLQNEALTVSPGWHTVLLGMTNVE